MQMTAEPITIHINIYLDFLMNIVSLAALRFILGVFVFTTVVQSSSSFLPSGFPPVLRLTVRPN